MSPHYLGPEPRPWGGQLCLEIEVNSALGFGSGGVVVRGNAEAVLPWVRARARGPAPRCRSAGEGILAGRKRCLKLRSPGVDSGLCQIPDPWRWWGGASDLNLLRTPVLRSRRMTPSRHRSRTDLPAQLSKCRPLAHVPCGRSIAAVPCALLSGSVSCGTSSRGWGRHASRPHDRGFHKLPGYG